MPLFAEIVIKDDIYAINIETISEIIPFIPPRPLAGSPSEVIGALKYRDEVIVVLDLCLILSKQPCQDALSSRIIIVQLDNKKIGLAAEKTTRIINIPAETLEERKKKENYLVVEVKDQLIQILDPNLLISSRASIFINKENTIDS